MGSTNLSAALDFSWNHKTDWAYQVKDQQLSVGKRIGKRINDAIIYIFASILGVNKLEKIGKKMISAKTVNEYKEYVSSKSHSNLRNESIILILNGENDIPVSPQVYQQLEEQSKCKIKFIKVSDLNHLQSEIKSLKDANNKIEALWIRAHGAPQAIGFNEQTMINIAPLTDMEKIIDKSRLEDTKTFLKEQINQLEEHAPIILESCFTGQKIEAGQENVAQVMASLADGRKVYAPSREALVLDKVTYTAQQGFKVILESFKESSSRFAQGSCLGRMNAIWRAFRNQREEITREFSKTA